MDDTNKALVLSLVRAHLKESRDYLSWVPPHRSLRRKPMGYSSSGSPWTRPRPYVRFITAWVGGHWRRQPFVKRATAALALTCHLPETDGHDLLTEYQRVKKTCCWANPYPH